MGSAGIPIQMMREKLVDEVLRLFRLGATTQNMPR